jgi:uncharacterized iron-regulated membrane protein
MSSTLLRQTGSHIPARHRLRGVLKWLHLWLGLTAGIVLVVVSLSGTVLAFQRELLLMAHPQLANAELPPVSTQGQTLTRIIEEWGPRGMRSADLPSAKLPVWQVFFSGGERRYFDATSSELLLTRSKDNDWVLWLRDLHIHLLAGETGEEVLGVFGLIALFILLSGLYLWWPRWRALAASLRWYRGPPTRRWLSWHRSSGALLLPVLLLVVATGVAMVYNQPTRTALRWTLDDGPEMVPPLPLAPTDQTIDWPALLAATEGQLAGGELRRIALPKKDDALVSIRARAAGEWHPNGRSVVWMDPYRLKAVQVYDATAQDLGGRISDAIYPLHGGFVGGRTWQWGVALTGLVPAFLLITGFLFWRARRRHAR